MDEMGIRVGYFGDFYPKFKNALFTTGTVYLLGKHEDIDSVYVYATKGCKIPINFGDNVHLFQSWDENSAFSLFKTLLLMNSHKKNLDAFFFNLSLTSQSKKAYINTIALLLPVLLSIVNKKKIVVYLHDIVETQNFEALGYKKSKFKVFIAKLLERLIAIRVTMILPMEYQVNALCNIRKKDIKQVFFPYAEAIWAFDLYPPVIERQEHEKDSPWRVLLWGSWGPKKDIFRVVQKLEEMIKGGCNIKVTVVGNINPHFTYYAEKIHELMRKIGSGKISFILDAPDEITPNIFSNSDILILPYLGSVGISGVMNIGAYYGLKIISYSIPELKDFDRMIEAETLFIPTGDLNELERALWSVIALNARSQPQYSKRRIFAMEMIGKLIECLKN
ncbi:MAG: glycosyltransferase [Candidatus Thermoplasmatota archaeon]|nr:glycosyltransferase [Candidatus Thermoplasmatota archaeon]